MYRFNNFIFGTFDSAVAKAAQLIIEHKAAQIKITQYGRVIYIVDSHSSEVAYGR